MLNVKNIKHKNIFNNCFNKELFKSSNYFNSAINAKPIGYFKITLTLPTKARQSSGKDTTITPISAAPPPRGQR